METGYTWKEVSQCQGQESDQQLLAHHTVQSIDVTQRRNGTSYAQINEIDSVGLGPSSAIYCLCNLREGFPGVSDGKKSACNVETGLRSLGWEDPLEKGTANHASIHVWRIPWTEKPGRLQFIESQRVGHDCVTDTHTTTLGKSPDTTQPEAFHLHFKNLEIKILK